MEAAASIPDDISIYNILIPDDILIYNISIPDEESGGRFPFPAGFPVQESNI